MLDGCSFQNLASLAFPECCWRSMLSIKFLKSVRFRTLIVPSLKRARSRSRSPITSRRPTRKTVLSPVSIHLAISGPRNRWVKVSWERHPFPKVLHDSIFLLSSMHFVDNMYLNTLRNLRSNGDYLLSWTAPASAGRHYNHWCSTVTNVDYFCQNVLLSTS